MAVEKMRGCGYRKVGGLYLCGEGTHMHCDRLPYELTVCPTCGEGIKFSRGFQWLDWLKYASNHGEKMSDNICRCPIACPVCYPDIQPQPYGLLWVGGQYYTPQSFTTEAISIGISKRIATIPRKLRLGETWILFAHMDGCGTSKNEQGTEFHIPGIFYAFRPQRVEKLIWQSEAKPEYIEELIKAGIIPIIVPDGDLDHDPRTELKPGAEEKSGLWFQDIRQKLRR